MIFRRIEIRNFCSVSSVDYDMSNQGVVLIDGKNDDSAAASSNGSGKSSTFVDSLVYAIFGRTTKGQAADSVAPSDGTKGTSVVLHLVLDDGRKVRIERYRLHSVEGNKVRLFVDDRDVSARTNPDTDATICSLLRTTYDSFLREVVFGQGVFFRFSALADQGRKEVLESILDLEVFEDARVRARKGATELKAKVDRAAGALGVAIGTVNTRVAEVDRLRRLADDELRQIDVQRERILRAVSDAEQALVAATKAVPEVVEVAPSAQVPDHSDLRRQISANRTKARAASNDAAIAGAAIDKLRAVNGLSSCPTCGAPIDAKHVEGEFTGLVRRRDAAAQTSAWFDSQATSAELRIEAEARTYAAAESERLSAVHRQQLARAAVTNAQTKLDGVRNQLAAFDAAPKSAYAAQLERAQTDLDATRNSVIAYQREFDVATDEHAIVSYWVEGFSRLRSSVVRDVVDYVNARIDYYAKVLTDGSLSAKMGVDQSGKITLAVSSAGGSYASASGGEKDRIDLAIAFALHDLALARSGRQSNLLILDEVANYLDQAGVARLMTLVHDKLRLVDTVFVISQNPTFHGQTERVWTVRKRGGKSTLIAT